MLTRKICRQPNSESTDPIANANIHDRLFAELEKRKTA